MLELVKMTTFSNIYLYVHVLDTPRLLEITWLLWIFRKRQLLDPPS